MFRRTTFSDFSTRSNSFCDRPSFSEAPSQPALSPIVATIVNAIKKANLTDIFTTALATPIDGAIIRTEQFKLNGRSKTLRRVYLAEGSYRIGWVVSIYD